MPSNRLIKIIFQTSVIALCFAIIVRNFNSLNQEINYLTKFSTPKLFALISLLTAIHITACLKLLSILKELGLSKISFFAWFNIYTISRIINIHVTEGANVYRSLKLKKDYDFSYTDSIRGIGN